MTHLGGFVGVCALAFALVGGAIVGCSGAPTVDTPDYVLDPSTAKPPGSSTSSGSLAPGPQASSDDANASSSGANDSGAGTSGGQGASSSGGSGASTPAGPISLKIDDVTVDIDDTSLWSEVSKPGAFDLFIKVSGPGVASGSDIHISATRVASGCDNAANYIVYRPQGDTQYMPKSSKEPACGLTIAAIPTAPNAHFRGKFTAALFGINTDAPKTKKVELTFDVVRSK
jgi:hypothetical protein